MNPYYLIDDLTTRRILKLIEACDATELGNASFIYYEMPKHDEVEFYLNKLRHGWQLVVNLKIKDERDIYKIVDNQLVYGYSEKD